jgi:Protein of unknown function (DUF3108)
MCANFGFGALGYWWSMIFSENRSTLFGIMLCPAREHRFDAFQGERRKTTRDRGSMCRARLLAPVASRCGAREGFSALRHCRPIRFLFAATALALSAAAAHAQSKLEARYSVSLAGIPLGSGTWVIDISGDQYTAVANGRTTGLVKLIADGSGSAGSRGTFQAASVASAGYMANTISDRKADEVRMVLRGGVVKEVFAEPPLEVSPDRVPVTDAHRKGVTDPMSAALMPVGGKGEVLVPEACKRKLAIFDGRQRADIDLVYKRMDQVKADKGYQGPVVVCTVLYNPIAGHRPERDAIKYLIAQRDMEMWLAPIAGTRLLVPFRFSVPTPLGLGLLQANYFVTQPQPTQAARPMPVNAKTQ